MWPQDLPQLALFVNVTETELHLLVESDGWVGKMNARFFISNTGSSLARAELKDDGQWHVEQRLETMRATYLATDPVNKGVVYAGTRDNGLLRSDDAGDTWQAVGLADVTVKSIAISRSDPQTIYVGAKPPALYVSHDGGGSWTERESFRRLRRWFWFTPAEAGDPYIMGLAVSPTDPNVVIAGVEYGGMFRSVDGGITWSEHLKSTSRDCHALKFHDTDGGWVYQAGGGWPAAVSSDGGVTWAQPRRGLRWSLYGMTCAADALRPEVWYLSAAPHVVFPQLHMMPRGHADGSANAFVFRKRGDSHWERLGGGLPQPLDYMAYELLTDPAESGHVYAGLSNGDVWHSTDYGDTWRQLPLNLTGIRFSLVML